MTEYGFLPPTIEITTAERVRLVVRNIGRLEHDFMPDDRGRALGLVHVHLAPGRRRASDEKRAARQKGYAQQARSS